MRLGLDSLRGAVPMLAGNSSDIRVGWLVSGDDSGGVGQAVRGMTSAVRSLGVEPVIISLRDATFLISLRAMRFDVRTLNVEPLPVLRGGLVRKIGLQLQVRRAVAAIRPQLADALRSASVSALHVLWPNLMPLAAMAAHDVGIPCFWEMPNIMGKYPFNINRRITQHILRKWDVTAFANSQYTASTLGYHPVRPIVLYLGADEQRFNPARADSVTREQLGIPGDAIALGIVARLTREKGQAVVLEAMAQLPEAYHNAHLLLLGGPVEGEFGDELRALAQRLGVADRLHLIGNVPDPERYYGAIDVAINAYLGAESFGLSVVEAMMMGKPVLVHALGGPAETVIDGVTGWHVHEPTVAGFRAGLIRALGDRKKWPAMGAAGRQRALEHFSLSRQAKQYVEIVRKRLGS